MTKDDIIKLKYSYLGGIFCNVHARTSDSAAALKKAYLANIWYGYSGSAANGHIKSILGVPWEHIKSYNGVAQSHIKTALGVEG